MIDTNKEVDYTYIINLLKVGFLNQQTLVAILVAIMYSKNIYDTIRRKKSSTWQFLLPVHFVFFLSFFICIPNAKLTHSHTPQTAIALPPLLKLLMQPISPYVAA